MEVAGQAVTAAENIKGPPKGDPIFCFWWWVVDPRQTTVFELLAVGCGGSVVRLTLISRFLEY